MIKLFRKIRQKLLSENRFNKYLIYVIGEIVLIVIGILIAINLNNSNQQKKLKESVDIQLSLLKQSIYRDSISFQGLMNYTEMQIKDSKRLIQLMNIAMNEENCEEFIRTFNKHLEVRTDISDRSIYDEMVNSGAFSSIKENKLKSQIATYYQLSEHFEGIIMLHVRDFREFSNQISMDGTIARSYFDTNSIFSRQEKCNYINSLIKNREKKQILENFFYSGIDTYEQINVLYSVLINRIMTGLPDQSD